MIREIALHAVAAMPGILLAFAWGYSIGRRAEDVERKPKAKATRYTREQREAGIV